MNASDCHRNRLVGFAGLQTLPRRGVQIVRATEIGVDIVSIVSARDNNADDVYAYLGGPDDLHSSAWKGLKPGESYETVPVAVGCVHGGFSDAVEALTRYRRVACQRPHKNNSQCPVIFNDYMNCLWGDPTEAKELPMIAAAAKAG